MTFSHIWNFFLEQYIGAIPETISKYIMWIRQQQGVLNKTLDATLRAFLNPHLKTLSEVVHEKKWKWNDLTENPIKS